MTGRALTISRLAQQAGVGVETVRYYQRIGLVADPVKPATGYRIYPEASLARIRFIQRAKQLGFSLAEITELLGLDDGACRQTRLLAERKLELIQAKIDDLSTMAGVLEEMIHSCQEHDGHAACPIIQSLSKPS